jgi:hypothetical protein
MSKVIYTAIIGEYDDLKQPRFLTQGWRYICFTDQDLKLPRDNKWEIVKVPQMECGQSKTARYHKINFHRVLAQFNPELSIWIDATFAINTNLDRWIRRHKAPFSVIKHPFDDCIYTEAANCIKISRGDPMDIMAQVTDYRREGMPERAGLISSGILVRNHTDEVAAFCEQWWSEVLKYSSRDQISFSYLRWKTQMNPHVYQWDYTTQKEFFHVPHLHKKWREGRLEQLESISVK